MANAGGAAAGHTDAIAGFVQHYLDYAPEDTIRKQLLDERLIAQNPLIEATHVSDMRQTIEQTIHILSLRPKIYKRSGLWAEAEIMAFNVAMAGQPQIPNWRSVSAIVKTKSVKSCKKYWVYTRELRYQSAWLAWDAAVQELNAVLGTANQNLIAQAEILVEETLAVRDLRDIELNVAVQLVQPPPEQ